MVAWPTSRLPTRNFSSRTSSLIEPISVRMARRCSRMRFSTLCMHFSLPRRLRNAEDPLFGGRMEWVHAAICHALRVFNSPHTATPARCHGTCPSCQNLASSKWSQSAMKGMAKRRPYCRWQTLFPSAPRLLRHKAKRGEQRQAGRPSGCASAIFNRAGCIAACPQCGLTLHAPRKTAQPPWR